MVSRLSIKTSLRDMLNQFWVQLTANLIMEFLQHRDHVNQPFLPRFNKVTKDNVRTHWSMIRSRIIDLTTHHICKNTCCILHFYKLHTCHANNEILYFEIYNLSRIITFNEHTYTEHLNNVLR